MRALLGEANAAPYSTPNMATLLALVSVRSIATIMALVLIGVSCFMETEIKDKILMFVGAGLIPVVIWPMFVRRNLHLVTFGRTPANLPAFVMAMMFGLGISLAIRDLINSQYIVLCIAEFVLFPFLLDILAWDARGEIACKMQFGK